MVDNKEPLWLEKYPISDPDHANGLEIRSALNEFSGKLPRHEAEAEAHKGYLKDQAVDSAAHHYNGMKAAIASGDDDSSKKHSIMYALSMKALGHESPLEQDPEVLNRAKHTPAKIYKFKYHQADSLLHSNHGEDSKKTDNT